MSAKKETKDKPDLSLIPYCVEVELAKAMMNGQEKYGRMNYAKGHNFNDLIAAMKRHLGKLLAGQDFDSDSGVHHLGHVMANALMALHQRELGTLKDDRFVATNITAAEEVKSSKFKVGDRVYCSFRKQEGVITSIDAHEVFPIEVVYKETIDHYTQNGSYFGSDNTNLVRV